MSTKDLLSTTQRIIKCAVPVIVLFAIVHIMLLICGVDEIYSEIFHESVGLILLLIAASIFHLCKLMKAMIWYKYAVELCIIFQRNLGLFGEYVGVARWIMLFVGIVLLAWLALNRCKAQDLQ